METSPSPSKILGMTEKHAQPLIWLPALVSTWRQTYIGFGHKGTSHATAFFAMTMTAFKWMDLRSKKHRLWIPSGKTK